MTTFPIGAWVRDAQQQRITGELSRDVNGRVGFCPSGGEIVATGKVGRTPVYRVRFAKTENVIIQDAATCYSCGCQDDASHDPLCPEPAQRQLPHEQGYAS